MARSSTEAEYRAIAHVATEILWVKSLLSELRVKTTQVPVVWCDNMGAASLAANPAAHARTKHIEIDIQFVQDMVARKES